VGDGLKVRRRRPTRGELALHGVGL
jgi:hypothetical protein